MPEENQNNTSRKIVKTIGIIAVVFLALLIVGFGLLVGVCGLMRNR